MTKAIVDVEGLNAYVDATERVREILTHFGVRASALGDAVKELSEDIKSALQTASVLSAELKNKDDLITQLLAVPAPSVADLIDGQPAVAPLTAADPVAGQIIIDTQGNIVAGSGADIADYTAFINAEAEKVRAAGFSDGVASVGSLAAGATDAEQPASTDTAEKATPDADQATQTPETSTTLAEGATQTPPTS